MTDGLGLGDAYDATLGRIKGQGGEKARLGIDALMWISHSERPLKADELCHALAVRIGSADLDGDNVPSIGTLLACCQGLITVDKEASTVRLIHFTVQEYLRAHPELFGSAHSTVAETCLSYLNSQQVKALSASPSSDLEDSALKDFDLQSTPFLEYSSLYWGTHAKRELSDCAKILALKLFDDYNDHISTKILLKAQRWKYRHFDFRKPCLFSGLHCASFFGIVEIVAGFVEAEGCDINQTDCVGSTPLLLAVQNGHERVVEILLGQDKIDPDILGQYGEALPSYVAWNGDEGTGKILLGRDDVKPDEPDKFGKTPLCCAVWNGHEGMVKMLLGRDDVNPNKPDDDGKTPLGCAAKNGHEGIVEILPGRDDVDPEQRVNGVTLLSWAAWCGYEGVVETLLRLGDVNPDRPDEFGMTPLSYAALNRQEGVLGVLFRRGIISRLRKEMDNLGRAPLPHSPGMGMREWLKYYSDWRRQPQRTG